MKMLQFFILFKAIFPETRLDTDIIIVLDAGSTGTQAFVYSRELEFGLAFKTKKISPPLSEIVTERSETESYLSTLLSLIKNSFLAKEINFDKIYILLRGTAGFRKLEKTKNTIDIWKSLQEVLLAAATDIFASSEKLVSAELLSGWDEGFYALLSLQQVLQTVQRRGDAYEDVDPDALGVLEIGGRSLQLAIMLSSTELGFIDDQNSFCRKRLLDSKKNVQVLVCAFDGLGFNEALQTYDTQLARKTFEPVIADFCSNPGVIRFSVSETFFGAFREKICKVAVHDILSAITSGKGKLFPLPETVIGRTLHLFGLAKIRFTAAFFGIPENVSLQPFFRTLQPDYCSKNIVEIAEATTTSELFLLDTYCFALYFIELIFDQFFGENPAVRTYFGKDVPDQHWSHGLAITLFKNT